MFGWLKLMQLKWMTPPMCHRKKQYRTKIENKRSKKRYNRTKSDYFDCKNQTNLISLVKWEKTRWMANILINTSKWKSTRKLIRSRLCVCWCEREYKVSMPETREPKVIPDQIKRKTRSCLRSVLPNMNCVIQKYRMRRCQPTILHRFMQSNTEPTTLTATTHGK